MDHVISLDFAVGLVNSTEVLFVNYKGKNISEGNLRENKGQTLELKIIDYSLGGFY